jgi:hypothetical protein
MDPSFLRRSEETLFSGSIQLSLHEGPEFWTAILYFGADSGQHTFVGNAILDPASASIG